MPKLLEGLAEGSRVAVVRLRSMGDCVLTTPALALLRQARPDLQVAVVVEPRFRDVYRENPDIDRLLEPDYGALARWHPRLLLNLHGGTRSAWMTALSLARFRAGFGHYRFPWLYNVRLPRAQEVLGEERTVHTAEHVASALFHLGLPRTEIPAARLFAPVPDAALSGDLAGGYCLLHPQATAAEKIWPAERFVELARRVRTELGLEPVFLGANAAELAAFAEFRQVAGAALWEAMGWIRGARLFVGNDSGPAHVAAAFGRPGVVLFGGSDPVVWAPWRCPALRQIVERPVAAIAVDAVIAALEAAMAAGNGGAWRR